MTAAPRDRGPKEELLRTSRELRAANREIEGLRASLRAERAGRNELVQVLSHELRTPITFVSGYLRLLLSEDVGPLTADQRRFLEESARGCERLSGFVERLLEAAPSPGVEVLEGVRYVRDGNLVTAAGVSAGIDMALWLVGQIWDVQHARNTQRMMEYDPAPPYTAEV